MVVMPRPALAAGAGYFYNAGQMTLVFSTINANSSGSGGNGFPGGPGGNAGAGGNGAGVLNTGDLYLETSTISGNDCGYGGSGAEGFFGGGGTGGAGGSGGGIYNAGFASVTSATIVLNATGTGGNAANGDDNYYRPTPDPSGGHGGNGGAILNVGDGTNVILANTLVALNATAPGGQNGFNPYDGGVTVSPDANGEGIGPDLAGDFTSQGFNLMGMADGSSGLTNHLHADQLGSLATPLDPLLGPLQMNGGPTPTHKLLTGSPAINQGNSFGARTDQRGYWRPYPFPASPTPPAATAATSAPSSYNDKLSKSHRRLPWRPTEHLLTDLQWSDRSVR